MNTVTELQTLADVRTARNMSLKAAADLLAATMGEGSRTSVSYHYIEKHGTTKYKVRQALATMYGLTLSEIDRMLDALPPRPQYSRS